MTDTLLKAFAFIFIILLAYTFKRLGLLKAEDSRPVARIVTNITLPCAVVNAFSLGGDVRALVMLPVAGLALNILVAFAGLLLAKMSKRDADSRALYFLGMSGYNIGSFGMPYVSGFLGAEAIVGTCMFDAGNALGCTGGTYAIIKNIVDKEHKTTLGGICKNLFSSVPFDAYLLMFILSMLGVGMPKVVTSVTAVIGSANSFLSMFLIGLLFELRFKKGDMSRVALTLVVKYSFAAMAALGFYFLTPFSLVVRQALAIVVFAPVPSLAPLFTKLVGGDHEGELASVTSSFSFVVSIAIMTALILVMGV